MYSPRETPTEENATLVKWMSGIGALMTAVGWGIIAMPNLSELLIIPTCLTIVALAMLTATHHFDEYQRAVSYAGAIGGMIGVTAWTAFLPAIASIREHISGVDHAVPFDPNCPFYMAATGFFIAYFFKCIKG